MTDSRGIIYVLASTDCSLALENRTRLTELADGFASIVVADGHYPCLSENPDITIYPRRITAPTGFRAGIMASTVFRELASRQSERYAVVIHGDMVPMAAFTPETLFQGKRYVVAGRYRKGIARPFWATQILGADLAYGPPQEHHLWPPEDATVYSVSASKPTKDRFHTEEIGPFHHLVAMGKSLASLSQPCGKVGFGVRAVESGVVIRDGSKNNASHNSRRNRHTDDGGPSVLNEHGHHDAFLNESIGTGNSLAREGISDTTVSHRRQICLACKHLRHTKHNQPYCALNCNRNGKTCQRLAVGKYTVALLKSEPWCEPWKQCYSTSPQLKDNPAE